MNKKGNVLLIILIIGVVAGAIYYFANSSSSNSSDLDNLTVTPLPPRDALLDVCLDNYKECVSIRETKNGGSNFVNKAEKFDNLELAKSFCNTWDGDCTNLNIYIAGRKDNGLVESDLPVVLISYVSITNWYGQQMRQPGVFMCNKEAELTKLSKERLNC